METPPTNGFFLVLFQKSHVFRGIEVARSSARILGVVLAYLSTARTAARAE
jgi:hypothetical protein